jgi:hypothetical protein
LIPGWNILLFTKSVNHLVQQKDLKSGATSSTSKFGDQSTLRAVDFRLKERTATAARVNPSKFN